MKIIKLHITIIFSLLIWSFSFAQQYTHYTTKNGLPSNNIYRITQDAQGFIWFVTDKGMVKFNGKDFKIFTTRQGLPTNDIWSIQATPDNKIWFFSKAPKLGYIAHDSIYSFESVNKGEILNPVQFNVINNTVFLINRNNTYFLNNNNLWEPLQVYTYPKTIFRNVFIHKKIKQLNTRKSRDSIFIINDKNKIVKSLKLLPIFNNIVTHGQINDSLYCLTDKFGYTIINLNSLQFISKKFKDEIKKRKISYSRFTVANNQIQFTGKNFAAVLDNNYNLINKVTIPNELKSHFSFIDKTGNVWIATLTNGVYKLPQSKINSTYCLENEKVWSIDKINNELIGSVFNKGFYKYDSVDKIFKPYLKEKGYMYKSVEIKPLNKHFFLTNTKIIEFSNGNKKIIDFEKREKKLNETARQLVYYNGFLYGNYSFGLNKINPNNLQIIKNYYQAGISSIINFQNQLIISTSNGIKVLKNDSIKTVLIQNKNFNKPILKLQKVSKSELVIGTDGFGAYLTDLKTITLLPKSDFLSVQNIFISNNNIWLATEIGVWHYKKINHNYKLIKHYTKADGLPEDKINSIYVKGNSIIIGSDNGVATIPIHNQQVTQFLDIYFENSAYNSKKMDKQHASFLYTKANNVTFSIATINHSVSNKEITYQYKLNPIQKKWINTSFKNLNFNDLPPNKYKLSVNSHGIIKSVNFQILPLWYQTSIAKIIFIVLFLTVTTGIILIIRKKELEKQLKKLNTQKQLSEFELHALRSQMNPHFVFNSLNAIQYYITKNDIELSEKYLVKFSRLIRKFFDFSRNKLINLEQEISLLKNYLEIEKMRFGNTFNFQFNIRENLNLSEEKIPSMLLQPIVENAVNHGLFHNEGNGLIKIDFLKNEDLLIVQISDNGIGLKKAQEIKDNSIKTHVSKSNSILKDRINLLNQSKEWFITYSINELKNATGTIVKLTFMHYEN